MAPGNNTRLVWFWGFWHWCHESHRDGALLRGPLEGIGSHWDEWYRHVASPSDREAIGETGRTLERQRQFLKWLIRRWGEELERRGNRLAPRYVVGQLARQEPFLHWEAFARYRTAYGVPGIAAIVLGENSRGEASDVREVEAIAFSRESGDTGARLVAEGFEPDGTEFTTVQHAISSLLSGPGLFGMFGLWLLTGRRPGSAVKRAIAGGAWVLLAAMLVTLLFGPDPGTFLVPAVGVMLGAWVVLAAHGAWVAGREGWSAWRLGASVAQFFESSHVRLRMKGGLYLRGASAGFAFCLNTLLALFRATPDLGKCSWIWKQSMENLRRDGIHWAATGVLTSDGWLKPVVLGAKLRACARRRELRHVLTPRQVALAPGLMEPAANAATADGVHTGNAAMKLGYAATTGQLRVHRCRHLAQAILSLGGLTSRWQVATNVLAIAVSVAMVAALPDIVRLLFPPRAPMVVGPVSTSPYWMWVSLDTDQPKAFRVRLESDYWANRVANVSYHGGSSYPPRAEIQVNRLPTTFTRKENEGVVWVERRRTFMGREFFIGERIGCFQVAQLSRMINNSDK